jgi:oligopeptide transport system ATP-binding protein
MTAAALRQVPATAGGVIGRPGDAPADAPVLEVSSLRKCFGELVAVDAVSFQVAPASSMAIVGESGSGKTTIAKMVVGLERPTAGTIVACGRDRSRPARSATLRRARGREVQIVFQDPYTSLDPRQTVERTLDEVLRLHHRLGPSERRARVRELTELVGLDARQARALPRGLSGGQRQRVAIARALAAEPRILILDEAVAALDVSIQAQVLNLLADIRQETGVSYLLISHDLAVVRQLTEETIVMHRGQVVERGATAEVLDNPQEPYTRQLRESVPRPGWRPTRRMRIGVEAAALGVEAAAPGVETAEPGIPITRPGAEAADPGIQATDPRQPQPSTTTPTPQPTGGER